MPECASRIRLGSKWALTSTVLHRLCRLPDTSSSDSCHTSRQAVTEHMSATKQQPHNSGGNP